MTGKRREVRQTIERMIFKRVLNEYRPGCDRKAWREGRYCCAHHEGINRTWRQVNGAIEAFTGGNNSINALIANGFSLEAILHWCYASGENDMMGYVREQVALRDGK